MPDSPSLSLVLRLRRDSALQGELVGQLEVVATGESVPLQREVELVGIVRRIAAAHAVAEGHDDVTS